GDGAMVSGNAAYVLNTDTSLSQNFNQRGYSRYTVDSPATDSKYTPNPAAPLWDYRVMYEAWIDARAFNGQPRAFVDHVHASPSKFADDTLYVSAGRCPPEWNAPTRPVGSSCYVNGQCDSLLCVNGICETSRPTGTMCTTGAVCASGLCTNGI